MGMKALFEKIGGRIRQGRASFRGGMVLVSCAAMSVGSFAGGREPDRGFSLADYVLDFSAPTDGDLQARLETIDADLRRKHGLESEQAAVGVLDLRTLRLAMIHPDRIEYAASVPKIGILLAYFQLHPEAVEKADLETLEALGLMVKRSSNEMATRFSRQMGLKEIQKVLDAYGFYDAEHGGGLWVGKHYGAGGERYGDPLGDNSHAATVRQLLRFYLLLEQGKLISTEASRAMRRIFLSPEIPHDNIKFVRALAGRDLQLLRKWGSWRDWLHDTAVVQGPGRHYILVGLTRHSAGDAYLEDLAVAVDDLLSGGAER
jgi:beta-lactamase class A